ILPADSSIPSTRSSSLLTPLTVPATSWSSGTVSFRRSSIIIFVDSRTRNRFTKTRLRKTTSTAQTIAAMSAAVPPNPDQKLAITGSLPSRPHRVRESYPAGSGPFVPGLFALPGGLVVAGALEPDRPVLLLHAMAGVVVRVLVALAVPQLAQPGVAGGLLQVQRDGVGAGRVGGRLAEGADHAVRLGRQGQVDGGLGQVQPRLRQPHVLHRLGRRHRDHQGPRIGQADVLAGVHHHPPGDVARILARLQHPGQPEQGGVGIRAPDALDERRDDVVVVVAL